MVEEGCGVVGTVVGAIVDGRVVGQRDVGLSDVGQIVVGAIVGDSEGRRVAIGESEEGNIDGDTDAYAAISTLPLPPAAGIVASLVLPYPPTPTPTPLPDTYDASLEAAGSEAAAEMPLFPDNV